MEEFHCSLYASYFISASYSDASYSSDEEDGGLNPRETQQVLNLLYFIIFSCRPGHLRKAIAVSLPSRLRSCKIGALNALLKFWKWNCPPWNVFSFVFYLCIYKQLTVILPVEQFAAPLQKSSGQAYVMNLALPSLVRLFLLDGFYQAETVIWTKCL